VRRTQLYLDEQLWAALHAKAEMEKTTVSELVRKAVRECYLGDDERRRIAMQEFVGCARELDSGLDSTEEVRQLRRGTRFERLFQE
jgi:hypothetical protein